jgi:hypothetical protein
MTRRLLAARRVPNGNWMWRTGCGIISGGTVESDDAVLLQRIRSLMARSGVRRSANKSVAKGSKRTSPGHSLPLPGVLHDARALAQMILDPL